MVAIRAAQSAEPATPVFPVRRIGPHEINLSLREGWSDFLSMRGDLIFVGLLYPLVGAIAAAVSLSYNVLQLFFPFAAGISLLGPIVAVGFYELARRREAGQTSNWSHFFDVLKRPSLDQLCGVAALLVVIFSLWVGVAQVLYAALLGATPPDSMAAFFDRLFTTQEGWTLILVGNLIGAGFALVVLAISFVSLPMLVDRNVDARTAIDTSIRAFSANKGLMIRWGVTVGVLLVLGSIPLFIGLAVVLPWLGYATWHLYTHVVDRGVQEGSAYRVLAGED